MQRAPLVTMPVGKDGQCLRCDLIGDRADPGYACAVEGSWPLFG
ncbi:hypothetical protein [Streptomyces inhibens]|nr:hypothetical protein [Streptomyces inhibens]